MRNLAKRAISLLCVLSMLLSMMITVQAAGVEFAVQNQTIVQGTGTETVEVPIKISGNTGILGMTLVVSYGEGLTLTGVARGEAFSSLAFTKPGNLNANPVNLVWDGESGADTSNGVVAVLTFTVPKDTAKEYPIEISTNGVFDDNLDPVTTSTVNGKIIVEGKGQDEPTTGTTFTVVNKSVEQGTGTETVEVPINISGNTGILGMTLVVSYEEGLTLTGVARGDAFSTLAFTKPGNLNANPVNLVWDGESGADTSNGSVAVLTFTVPKGTAKEYPIEISTNGIFDDNLLPVTVSTVNGKIIVESKGQDEPTAGTTFTVVNKSVEQGTGTETVEVPINISGNTGILGMTLVVSYGEGLTLTGVARGEAFSSLAFTKPGNLNANPVNLVWDGESGADTSNGSVAVLTFTVPKGTAKEYPIEISTNGIFDDNLLPVTVSTVNGKIIVTGGTHSHSYGEWEKADAENHKKTCACGDVVTEAHKWDAGQVTTAATHTKDGVMTYTCTVCDATKTEVIPADADNHSFGKWTKVDDNKHSRECACGKTETADHSWNDGVVTTQSTHLAEGVKTFTCAECGATKTEKIDKLPDHTYGDWTKADDTNHKKTCACGDVVTEAHKWDAGVVTKAATHTETGIKTYTCSVCKAEKTEIIPAYVDDHTFGKWTKVDDNKHSRECACGKTETADHSWNDGVVTTQPTHLAEGVKTFTCAECGATKTEKIDKLPDHTYGDWTKADDTNHKKTCACGDVVTEAHKWDNGQVTTAATHTKDGVMTYTCTVCDATKTEVIPADADNHSFGKWTKVDDNKHSRECACGKTETADHSWNDGVVTTQPTHLAEGVKTFTCAECGATKTEKIDKLPDHTYGDWTKADDTNHKKTCACGDVVTEAHKWDAGVVTKAATHTETGIKTYTCSVCKAEKTETIPAYVDDHTFGKWTKVDDNKHSRECACGKTETADHGWNDGVVTTQPTHLAEGVKTFTCAECNHTKTEKVDKLPGHTYGEWEKADAENHKKTCACGDVVTEAHKWDNGQVTTAATHTKDGVMTYTCTVCDATKTEVIPADADNHSFGKWTKADDDTHTRECACGKTETAAHNWNEGVVTTEPTHMEAGVKTYTCSDCKATKIEKIPAKFDDHSYGEWEKADDTNHKKTCECGDVVTEAHKWDDGQVTTAATHTKDGVMTYTCTVCDATKTEVIPAKADDHTFGKWTKADDDTHSRECACGKKETAEHNWNDGVVTTQPTHLAEGVKTFTCADCGATKTEKVDKLPGHTYGEWTKADAENHKKTCACGDVVTEAHKWDAGKVTTAATHTKDGVMTYTCTVCDATKTEVIPADADNHSFGKWTKADDDTHTRECACGKTETAAHKWDEGQITTQPTHLAEGVKTFTCADCGATKTETIDKTTAHSYGEWEKADDTNHKKTCECGDVVTEAHKWDDGQVTTAATHTKDGVMTYTCTVCDATKTEVIPAKADDHTFGKWTKADDDTHSRECACGKKETAEHNWYDGVVTTQPTHLAEGVKTFTCAECGATKTEKIDKLPDHTYGDWTKADDTNHKKTCECGDVVTEAHKWDAGKVTTAATHTTTGIKTYTCTVCDATKTEVIPADADNHTFGKWTEKDANSHERECGCGKTETADHNWNDGVVTTQPTHLAEGVKTFTCADCGATKTEKVDKLPGHTYGEWEKADAENHKKTCECGDVVTEAHKWDAGKVTTAATHTTTGIKTYTCTVCDATKTEVIPADADNHTFGKWTKVDDNKHSRECGCGKTETADHSWNDGVVTTQPTHLAEGVKTFTCADCGATKTEKVDKLPGHTYGEWEKTDAENHKKTCACGDVVTEAHKWDDGKVTKEPTHVTTGVKTYTCESCKTTKTEIIEKIAEHKYSDWTNLNETLHKRECTCGNVQTEEHKWDEGVVTTDATHTSYGVKTYTCSVCKAIKTEKINKLTGHSYGAWAKRDDVSHIRECACGMIEVSAHKWNAGEVTTVATHVKEGAKTFTCSECEATKVEKLDKIPGHSFGDWTRVDNNNHKRTCECGEEEIAAHTWNEGEVTNEPTESTTGTRVHTCSACGGTKTEELPVLTHKHTLNKTKAKAATCTEAGNIEYYTCSGCNKKFKNANGTEEVQNVEVAALGHSAGKFVEKIEPTCNKNGRVAYYECANEGCKVKFADAQATIKLTNLTIPKAHVSLVEIPGFEATCTHVGLSTGQKCTACNVVIVKQAVIPKLSHSLTEVAEIPATCEADGTKGYYNCSGCGKKFTNASATQEITELVIPALGHTYGAWEITTPAGPGVNGEKTRVCQNNGNHVETAVIPALDGACANANNHSTTEFKVKVEATCTTNGVKQRYCDVCGEFVGEPVEITAIHQLEDVSATPNCLVDGIKAHKHCSVCGKNFINGTEVNSVVAPAKGEHTWSEYVNDVATCTVCGETKKFVYTTTTDAKLDVEDLDSALTETDNSLIDAGLSIDHQMNIEDVEIPSTELSDELENKGFDNHEKFIVDITIDKHVTNGSDISFKEEVRETEELMAIEFTLPSNLRNKLNYFMLRVHEGVADEITTTPNAHGEYIVLDLVNHKLTMYVRFFSEYAIFADGEATTPSTPHYGGSSVSRYTVKFESNGGSNVKSATVARNTVVAEPTSPTKEGFKFDGWYTDKELTSKYDFAAKVTKNITLYAKWVEVKEGDDTTDDNWFVDVEENDWFYASVKYVVDNNLMNGVSNTEFAPDDTLTRAMLVTVLYRNEGEPATNRSIPFADVDMGSYYGNAVSWAKQNGIVSGVTENNFAPNTNITREQIATIMFRYAQYKGMNAVTLEDNLHFTDSSEISEYAVSAMNWAVGTGLMKGKSATTINPKDNATRAEIAAILQRFIEANK